MTAFNDDDLKRLKDVLGEIPGVFSITFITKRGSEIFDPNALLARLDAAEAFIWDHKDPILHDKLLNAWRKAAGKDR